MSYVKIGVAGPVGSGKTALIEALSRKMAKDYSIGVITNDIYTKEDAQFLAKNSVLPVERIIGVETGRCPHTAIREDASMNLEAVDEMMERFPDIQILFIESGGDNLSATFSPELVDATVFVIDVAEGDKIPRKGGPGITRSDLLVINKAAGMPIHPSLHNYDNSLGNALAWYFRQKNTPFVFRCINRLDRDTSGLTIVAKHMVSGAILGLSLIHI